MDKQKILNEVIDLLQKAQNDLLEGETKEPVFDIEHAMELLKAITMDS